MHRAAYITKDGLYRMFLIRVWDSKLPSLCICMLNPSKADAEIDDPTVLRVIAFAKALGFGSVTVVNLFAYRATDPQDLFGCYTPECDPVGIGNDQFILAAAHESAMVICAWGNHGSWLGRDQAVIRLFHEDEIELHALKINKSGQPAHPLYLSASLRPIPF